MLTDNLAWQTERIVTREYEAIEYDLISKIIEDICQGSKALSADSWRYEKLKQLASWSSSWEMTLRRLVKEHEKDIVDSVKEAMGESARLDDYVISKVKGDIAAGVTSIAFKVRLDEAVKLTKQAMNITNTKAIAGAQQAFLDAVNSAYLRTVTGVSSLDQAIKDAVNAYSRYGMSVQYVSDSGKITTYSVDAAVRRDIITTLGQAAADYSGVRAKEYGTDLVQVSSHFGARPEHAVWQGKVYSLSGKTKGYQKLSDATGYGTVTGLCGINCRHTFWPYFAGYSKDIDPNDIPGLQENKEQYEAQQKQRAYERTLRSYKRQIKAAEIAGDVKRLPVLKGKLSDIRKRYLVFLEEKGLTRFAEREIAR